MKKKLKQPITAAWRIITASSFMCVYSCTPIPTTSRTQLKSSVASEIGGSDLAKLKNQHQAQLRKNHTFPFNDRGAIELEIANDKDQPLMFGKVQTGFQINSTHNQIWAHIFNKTDDNLDTTETINLNDENQRYQLSLSPDSANQDTSTVFSVWINDVCILDKVSVNQNYTLAQRGLRKQNTLRVLIQGEQHLTLNVNLQLAGEGGVIFRRKGNNLQSSTNDNSGPSLNMEALIASGLLPAVPGNRNERIPETQIAEISLNQHAPEEIATAQVYIQVAEPESANLAEILEKYNAVVIQEPIENPRFYLIQPDLRKVNLDELEVNLRQLNANQEDDYLKIQRARFGNLESAKTFAFAVALISDPKVESVGFNPVLHISSNQSTNCDSPPRYTNQGHSFEGLGQICVNSNVGSCAQILLTPEAQNFWWLTQRSTYANQAWRYSQGYSQLLQKPVQVAVIDQGFAGLKNLTQAGNDLHNRVLLNQGGIIQLSPNQSPVLGTIKPFTTPVLDELDNNFRKNLIQNRSYIDVDIHGTEVISTIASNYNDGKGVVGVAPLAQVIPYFVGGSGNGVSHWSEVVAAIKAAGDQQVSAINISMNSRDKDIFLKGYFSTLSKYSWIAPAQTLIRNLSERGTAVVVSAGNFGWPAVYTLPGKLYFPEIIMVGALTDQDPRRELHTKVETRYSSGEITQTCNKFESLYLENFVDNPQNYLKRLSFVTDPYKMQSGSNYGDTSVIDIWAPGDKMLGVGPELTTTINTNTIQSSYWGWSATSAAAPMVTGSIALMKALRPNISVEEIRRTLKGSADEWTYEDTNRRSLPFLDRTLSSPPKREDAECGYTIEGSNTVFYNCGKLLSSNDDRTQRILSLRIDKAIENLPGIAPESIKAKTVYGNISNGQFNTLGLNFDILQAKQHFLSYGTDLVISAKMYPNSPEMHGRLYTNFFQVLPGPMMYPDQHTTGFQSSACKDTINCFELSEKWQKNRYKKIEDLVLQALPSETFKAEVILNQGLPKLLSLEKMSSAQITSQKRDLISNQFCTNEDQTVFSNCPNLGNPYDLDGAYVTWRMEPNEQGELCVKIDNCANSPQPTPVPTYDPTANPIPSLTPLGFFSAPVVVSEPAGATNIRPVTNSQPKSILREGPFAQYTVNILGTNATAGPAPAAQWVSIIDPSQTINVTYPMVPNTINLNDTSELHFLRILLQVKNQGKGGQIYVEAGGDTRTEKFGPGTRYPDGELQPILFDFIESAKETGATTVKIRIENAQPGMQIIYKMFGIPKK